MTGGVAHLASGSRDGRWRQWRQAEAVRFLASKVPDISLIGHAIADCLGGIDNASAAYCQDKVDSFPPAQCDSLAYFGETGFGTTPPKET